MDKVTSKNGIAIRLTDERWRHIAEEHGELDGMRQQVLDAVKQPDRILVGSEEELLAVRQVEAGKFLVVVYREFKDDGFVVTAFLTRRHRSLAKRKQIWP